MATLPTPGGDNGTWGTELNEFLQVAHGAGGLVDVGTGDAVSFYNATTAQMASISAGTSGSPDTNTQPLLKVERTVNIAEAAVTGDGVENLASIIGIGSGTSACQTQSVGVAGFAKNASTAAGGTAGGNDACGLYGGGNITGSGTGVGIGGFFIGRNDSTDARCVGLETGVYNGTGTHDSYISGGFNDSQAIWITTSGPHRAGAAMVIGAPAGFTTFDVGIGVTSQNPVLTTTFRDDGNAATSLLINGTHATASIQVAAGAGVVAFGDGATTSAELYVKSNADARFGLMVRGNSATQSVSILAIQDYAGTELFSVGSSGNLRVIDHDFVFGTTTGTKFGTSTSQKLAFFNSTPIVKPTVSGAKGSNAALGSLMTALANLGLVVDSTSA